MRHWITEIEEDQDGCLLTFPDELIEEMGLKEGDVFEIEMAENSLILKLKNENKDD